MEATISSFLTCCPSRTATLLIIPDRSARIACHSNGSTFPFVGSVLTSVMRFTRTKVIFGPVFRRQTDTPATAAATTSSASANFFKFQAPQTLS